MKRRVSDIHRTMNISRFAKSDVAELPLAFSRRRSCSLDAKARFAQRDHHIVVCMHMPERYVAGGHCHIPNTHKFIFEFWVMMRFALDFNDVHSLRAGGRGG